MTGYVRWSDIRAEHVARGGGEDAVEAGKQELLAVLVGHRLAEVRRARGLTRQQGLACDNARSGPPGRECLRVGWSRAAGFEDDPSGDLLDLFDGEPRLGGFENTAGEDAPDES